MPRIPSCYLHAAVVAGVLSACAPTGDEQDTGVAAATLGEWREHGADKAATLYSALDQIDADNAVDLRLTWRWASIDQQVREARAELGSRRNQVYAYEATPLMVGGVLYTSTSLGQVAALDPATGETLWSSMSSSRSAPGCSPRRSSPTSSWRTRCRSLSPGVAASTLD